jgi:hypothetical protein
MKLPILDRAEWDFESWANLVEEKLGYHALVFFYDYEFSREVGFLVEAMSAWRKGLQSDFESLLEYSWRISPLGFIRNFFCFPEWPSSPIQTLEFSVLKRRYDKLGFPDPLRKGLEPLKGDSESPGRAFGPGRHDIQTLQGRNPRHT